MEYQFQDTIPPIQEMDKKNLSAMEIKFVLEVLDKSLIHNNGRPDIDLFSNIDFSGDRCSP